MISQLTPFDIFQVGQGQKGRQGAGWQEEGPEPRQVAAGQDGPQGLILSGWYCCRTWVPIFSEYNLQGGLVMDYHLLTLLYVPRLFKNG